MIPQHEVHLTWRDCWEVVKTLRSGWIGPGKEVQRLESRLAEMHGTNYCVATTSGTMALWLAYQVARYFAKSQFVTCPAYGFPAVVNVAEVTGNYDLKYGDISPISLCMKPCCVEKDGVVFTIHQNGETYERKATASRCIKTGAILIEDACQAFGMFTGLVGRFACLSFSPFKPITASQGGAVLVDDPEFANKLRCLACHGIGKGRAELPGRGLNLRMSDMQASLLNSQLDRWGKIKSSRQRMHDIYCRYLDGKIALWTGWSVIVKAKYPSVLRNELKNAGIESAQYYRCLPDNFGSYPIAEEMDRYLVYLPSSPQLTVRQIRRICELVLWSEQSHD